jgi:hypothetical protein
MKNCPVCGGLSDRMDMRTFLAVLAIGLFIGFVGGQFFYAFQIKPLYKDKVESLEKKNEELRKGYVPPAPKKGEKGITY